MSDYCYCDQCEGRLEPPEPCEYCWVKTGRMQACDGSCDSLTQRQYERHYGHYRWQGKPLLRKGGKP